MNEYWNTVRPTYIENWPAELRKLSMKSIDIPLSIDEANMLGVNMIELNEIFIDSKIEVPRKATFRNVISKLKDAFQDMPNGAFVKLGSRSPKDRLYYRDIGNPCKNADDALKILLGCSERICDDLYLAVTKEYCPHIWIREWVNIPKWAEFRCFVYKNKLLGISQYFYDEYFPEIINNDEWIKALIKKFYSDYFKSACHLDTVIFDVYLEQLRIVEEFKVNLIEINPFIESTDFCLHNDCRKEGVMSPPDFSKFDGGFRYVKEPILDEFEKLIDEGEF